MSHAGFFQPPSKSQINYLRTDISGGYAYYPETIEKGLATTSVLYTKIGNIINCSDFANLLQLYTDINNATPNPFQMSDRWIMQDLHQTLDFQVNGETIQRLRLVKRNTFTHTNQNSISEAYETFYVPTYVAFDAKSPTSIFDSIYVSRIG